MLQFHSYLLICFRVTQLKLFKGNIGNINSVSSVVKCSLDAFLRKRILVQTQGGKEETGIADDEMK